MKAKASISVGDKVYVVQKTKKTLGVVEKVNIKKAIVTLPEGRYNVPLTMLECVMSHEVEMINGQAQMAMLGMFLGMG